MPSPSPDKSTDEVTHSTHEISKRRRGGPDATGNTIDNIFHTHLDHWIVYKSHDIHYEIADELAIENPPLMECYLNRVAEIQDLKAQIVHLLPELKDQNKYDSCIADAIALALRNNVVSAKRRLEEAVANIKNEYYIIARFRYLEYTMACSVPLIIVLMVINIIANKYNYDGKYIVFAGTAGLVGAIFSIAIAVRSRTVGTDTNSRALLTDCFVRLVIGVISGCFFQLLVEAGAFPKISVGDAVIQSNNITWRMVVTVGFVAGFLERLVPNFLQNAHITPLIDHPQIRRKADKPHRGVSPEK
jgi:hypothetical protein